MPTQNPRSSQRSSRSQSAPRRQRTVLSREAIVDALIKRLDAEGIAKTTLRSIAADLGTGAASLYWYAKNKKELLSMASDALVEAALHTFETGQGPEIAAYPAHPGTPSQVAEALTRVKQLVACLTQQLEIHPWLSELLVSRGGASTTDLKFWDRLGQLLSDTELGSRSQFDATTAITSFAVAAGSELISRAQSFDSTAAGDDPHVAAEQQAGEWSRLDADEFPFVHSVVHHFADFNPQRDFFSRLDFLLAGVEQRCLQQGR